MSDSVSYDDLLKEFEEAAESGKPDPRLVALVHFLARRAAERDYERLLKKARRKKRK